MLRLKILIIIVILIITSTLQSVGANGVEMYEDSNNTMINCELETTHIDKMLAYPPQITTHQPQITYPLPISSGSWSNTFSDTSAIDWALTDHINISFGNVKLDLVKPEDHTVALWHLDKGSGVTAFDESPKYINGTLGGNGIGIDLPSWVSGVHSNALSFDGTDDYVDFGSDAELNLRSDLTIEGWIYPTGWGEYLNYGFGRIVDKDDILIYLHNQQNTDYNINSLIFTVNIGATNYPSSTPSNSISLNEWQYIAVTYDSTDVKMYINGVSQTLKQPDGAPSGNIDDHSAHDLFMGESALGDRAFDGIIDEVRISNKSLSPNVYNGNLTSERIDLPAEMQWDTLIIDKTIPQNTAIEVKILNASNNQQIPGSLKYIDDGEFDISYIDPVKYPSIKLNATFVGKQLSPTPVLHYWGVSWNRTDQWTDTFFGGMKVDSSANVNANDGTAQFRNNGILISRPIEIPDYHYYDSLIINKFEPTGTSLKVSILDGQTENPILGFSDLTSNSISLSGLDPLTYGSIKLKASFTSSGQRGNLLDWNVNWTKNLSPSIDDINNPEYVNRAQSIDIKINLSDKEDIEQNLTVLVDYKPPSSSSWMNQYLTTPYYSNDHSHWVCKFTPTIDADLGLYSFRVSCIDRYMVTDTIQDLFQINVVNNPPEFISVLPSKQVLNRTDRSRIDITVADIEIPVNQLELDMKFKQFSEPTWDEVAVSSYSGGASGYWYTDFIPSANAKLGRYLFNITCNDSVEETFHEFELLVLNNIPSQPNITISPNQPKTLDDLEVFFNSFSKDIEIKNLEYWYVWFKDEEHIPIYDNFSVLPNNATQKDETWKCVVYPFDGDELGPRSEDYVTIQNSEPEVIETINNLEMLEDTSESLGDKLAEIFGDNDNDTLQYSHSESKTIRIQIFNENGTVIITPDQNWYGTEFITFYATDQLATAEHIVKIVVKPTNDMPEVIQIGTQLVKQDGDELEFIVDEDDELLLEIVVEDIDGDVNRNMIKYSLNVSESQKIKIKSGDFVFQPENSDVGWHYFTVKVTDGNETPIQYVNQTIRIQVLNVNDKPTVNIISPIDRSKFEANSKITFDCEANDPDLSIIDSAELLSYSWKTNKTKYMDIGSTKKLTDLKLSPGHYKITVTVTDKTGEHNSDSVNIFIKSKPKTETEAVITSSLMFLVIILVTIVIIIIILFVFFKKRKKKKMGHMGLNGTEVLHPIEAYQHREAPVPKQSGSEVPKTEPQLIEVGMDTQQQTIKPIHQHEPIMNLPSPAQTVVTQHNFDYDHDHDNNYEEQAPTQLPLLPTPYHQQQAQNRHVEQMVKVEQQIQAQLHIDENVIPQPPPPSTSTFTQKLDLDQKMELLVERFINGEIPQDLYLKLKAKYEAEKQNNSKQEKYQPVPKMLPSKDKSGTPRNRVDKEK